MTTVAIIGATRGLGDALVKQYASKEPPSLVIATSRRTAPDPTEGNIRWISGIDIGTPDAGPKFTAQYGAQDPIDVVILTAGYFGLESFDSLDWDKQLQMYKTSAIGPVFFVKALVDAGLLKEGSKVILVSSESGSIALRHEKEGGGNYGHHASKAAENMVGKLLSLDLKGKRVAVANVHPGFMRTEMTKGVGFDRFWDEGGAVTPEVAAKSLADWIEGFDIGRTGTYWAPRGAGDIGTADVVLGPKDKLPTPLELPW